MDLNWNYCNDHFEYVQISNHEIICLKLIYALTNVN